MKTTFHTDEYVRAHGKNPRGDGRWAFRITGSDGLGSWTTLDECCFFSGTLTSAKRAAKDHGSCVGSSIGRIREMVIDILG